MELSLLKPLVCIDIESTGLDIVHDRIIEICMVKLYPDKSKKIKTLRINPNRSIPQESIQIHGITDEMVRDCPKFLEVANVIKQFVEKCDLCGYNCVRFDIPLLVEEFLRAGMDNFDINDYLIIDVQRIFHKLEPRDLPSAYKFYCNQTITDHHDAQADAEATLDVLLAQVKKYNQLGDTLESIEKQIVGELKSLDSMNRFVLKNGIPIFNFGKHKGKSVEEVLHKEPNYYDWMMKSDFGLHTKKVLSSLYAKFTLAK